MRAGDFFGELALFPGQTHTAGAVAQAASLVLCLPFGDFLAELDSHPALMRRLLDAFAQRLRASSERESALAFMTAPARLARLLLQNVAADGLSGPLVTISQEDLAPSAWASRARRWPRCWAAGAGPAGSSPAAAGHRQFKTLRVFETLRVCPIGKQTVARLARPAALRTSSSAGNIRVLRLKNAEVRDDLAGVLERILAVTKEK